MVIFGVTNTKNTKLCPMQKPPVDFVFYFVDAKNFCCAFTALFIGIINTDNAFGDTIYFENNFETEVEQMLPSNFRMAKHPGKCCFYTVLC
ncbi:hypothetical protein DespoDRAFT_03121 [Desulfobacter postgatei 2ac9]|uniref:Uncharacterized protein n=1 Tax=Desulfobacter postgatei 2ac9 TaxID=879212 RepID=I5B604_9BACT|nr:hypothetical protein DespoDRAFT_03121 [Desulfobacter postgatei 2ac9]